MSNRECNYCQLQRLKQEAKRKGVRIILKKSSFAPFDTPGIDVFEVPKGTKLPPYKNPCHKLPNGCPVYQKYHRIWFGSVGDHCEC